MRIVLCHNYYQQPGGEDAVFADEAALLERHGHDVLRFTVHNDEIKALKKVPLALATMWNRKLGARLESIVRDHRADLVHFHNTFPLISPSGYRAASRAGAAVVQTLHNYRLLCPAATLFRDGQVCTECVGKRVPWPAVSHGCYRDSRVTSAVVATMIGGHTALGTWSRSVDRFIALTHFARGQFIAGGLPAKKLSVKSNFVDPVPEPGAGDGNYAVFVGRLSPEKGLRTLLDAWRIVGAQLPLKVVGSGPLDNEVAAAAVSIPGVTFLGQRSRSEVDLLLKDATCLVFPSLWYEGFPKTILEAFGHGTPVIASRLGSMAEIIAHGRTGWLFPAGNADALARSVLERCKGASLTDMRSRARTEFLTNYTAETNYHQLMTIYDDALATSCLRRGIRPIQVYA